MTNKACIVSHTGILASSPHAGLMGDFNFDSDRNFRKGCMHL